MQLGFVIDHSRCIGCHACTVACKSENEVPLGDFRTWVKYVEEGDFPEVRRSFSVLRCNQCTDAPCVTICPVTALDKRPDGIVDIDSAHCIGCKACMHGCPYDALYLNEDTGMAEKCHFCAHRTELGLAPACAVVCPTEAIIPGDFHDPESRVSRMREEYDLSARKTEAGTGPNVFYREVSEPGIDPAQTTLATGTIWSQRPEGPRVDAQVFEALEHKARARTVYDVPRKQLWGAKITGYLLAKSLAAGVFPVGALALWARPFGGAMDRVQALAPALVALLFLGLTGGLLVADLKRPDRFWKILLRPNWDSWLARGTFVIVAYSALLVGWIAAGLAGVFDDGYGALGWTLLVLGTVLGGWTAAYTGWLFGQAKGRVLWMKRGLWAHLAFQALLAGAATAALCGVGGVLLKAIFVLALLGHGAFALFEGRLAPAGREAEYARAARLVSHGPYAILHHYVGLIVGVALPLVLMFIPFLAPPAGLLALIGLAVEEDITVRAGQALPIS